MKSIKWDDTKVKSILDSSGSDFARVKTPHGYRGLAKKYLLQDGMKRLEGNCFKISFQLANILPDLFYYREGYAEGMPHAWVSLKQFDEDWCIDVTWPFFTLKAGYREWDNFIYSGVKFEAEDVKHFILDRLKNKGSNSTSFSMLKYPDETVSLIKHHSRLK